jgi:hypothetical protein
VPHQHLVLELSFNHLQLSHSILPHTTIHRIHTIHLLSVIHRMKILLHCIHILHLRSVVHRIEIPLHLHHMAIHHIHILLPQPVVHQVVLLLNHIHTLHFGHIYTLHLNLFTLEVVTTQVARRIPLIQLKLLR